MVIKSSNIILPEIGKKQIDLRLFNYSNKYRDNLFTIFLPCSKTKPYFESSTHRYFKLKIHQYIPSIWIKLIKICTISEVLGIIPEELEEKIFSSYRNKYYYEHYPTYKEGDIHRTSNWLKNYINNYGTKFNYAYCTSKTFREISKLAKLKCLPENFKKESALFEFRKIENIKQLTNLIIDNYMNILINRFNVWKENESHSYKVLKFAKENTPFTFNAFKNRFKKLKNPRANLDTFCHESNSDKGIFLFLNNYDNKFYFPEFIINFLKF
ncbi:MAG: DUF5591 domain-containing protein [Promethearchaeota archaeon]